ncbi:hypothetical protein ON05_006690 [Acaryochloris sp. CCMEE 5410]|nr:hypothetical protein ON05_006690 [Acaryochloris sp. CCMEE 5410]
MVTNAIIMATPSSNIEFVKNITLTFANIVMFILIWDAYFDDKLSRKSPWGIIKDLLTVTAVSTITTFITYQILIKKITPIIISWGDLGWIVGGGISGIATTILGVIWALYCDDLYRNSTA